MVTTALPYASFYGAGVGTPYYTGDPNPEFYATRLASMIHKTLYIGGSQLLPYVQRIMLGGERFGFPRIKPNSYTRVTNRHIMQLPSKVYDALLAAVPALSGLIEPYQEVTGDMRWCFPQIAKWNPVIGAMWDPLFMGEINPDNEWVQIGRDALGRWMDRIMINDGFFGTAFEGHGTSESGVLTQVAWDPDGNPSQCYRIDSEGVGLTKDKVLAAEEKANILGWPQQGRIAIITPKQQTDILNDPTLTSGDWRTSKPLDQMQGNNRLNGLLGWNWVSISPESGVEGEDTAYGEIIPKVGTDRRCIFTHARCLGFGKWAGRDEARAYERNDMSFTKLLWISSVVSAVRKEEKYMMECRCTEAA